MQLRYRAAAPAGAQTSQSERGQYRIRYLKKQPGNDYIRDRYLDDIAVFEFFYKRHNDLRVAAGAVDHTVERRMDPLKVIFLVFARLFEWLYDSGVIRADIIFTIHKIRSEIQHG